LFVRLIKNMPQRFIFILFFLIGGWTEAQAAEVFSRLEIISASGKTHIFKVELANTPESRNQGLMHRRSMSSDAGMLFDFGIENRVSMWMKNTLIPLDMLFIDAQGKIVNIAERTIPHSLESIPANKPVRFVLELNGGSASRLGIKPGDQVKHKIISP
jgi:uncharacterized membrane protein (UPF0127 family)